MNGPVQEPLPVALDVVGNGPPILFFHGRFADERLWEEVAQRLAERHCTVRCRLEPQPAGGSLIRTESILACLDRLNLCSAHLVSHGSAWSPVTEFAAAWPGRARSLTLVDPMIPRTDLNPAVQEHWHLEMLLQWLATGHGSKVRQPEHVAFLRGVMAQQTHARMTPEGNESQASAAFLPPPLLGCPVQALVGADSPAESKALVAAYLGKVRHARTLLVPRAARHSPVEAPEAVARLIGEFVQNAGVRTEVRR